MASTATAFVCWAVVWYAIFFLTSEPSWGFIVPAVFCTVGYTFGKPRRGK